MSEQISLTGIADRVAAAADRVATLGGWDGRISSESLTARVPDNSSDGLGGFDAGIACALDLIPRHRQRLSAAHHAAYRLHTVNQARREIVELDADSETCWWLAACSVCDEGPVGSARFIEQLKEFEYLRANPDMRLAAAVGELALWYESFEVCDGVTWSVRDGGAQGAYLAGWDLVVSWSERYDIFFVSTFHPSLGLEHFPWRHPGVSGASTAALRAGRSGPVWGSTQYVKACDRDELEAVLAAVRLDT